MLNACSNKHEDNCATTECIGGHVNETGSLSGSMVIFMLVAVQRDNLEVSIKLAITR